MLRRCLIVAGLAVLLMGCDSPLGSTSSPPADPRDSVQTKPTPTFSLDETEDAIRAQIEEEGIRVHDIHLVEGVLPVLKITYAPETAPAESNAAQLAAELEQSLLVVSKVVALYVEQGAPVERLELTMALADDPSIVAGVTRISIDDLMEWHAGALSDQEYIARMALTTN